MSQQIIRLVAKPKADPRHDEVLQALEQILRPLICRVVRQTSGTGTATTKGTVSVRIRTAGGGQRFEVSTTAEETYYLASSNELTTFATSIESGILIREEIDTETLEKRCESILEAALKQCAIKRLPELLAFLEAHGKKKRITVRLLLNFRAGTWCGLHIDRDEEVSEA